MSGSYFQSHCDIVLSVDGIYVSGYCLDWSIKLSVIACKTIGFNSFLSGQKQCKLTAFFYLCNISTGIYNCVESYTSF